MEGHERHSGGGGLKGNMRALEQLMERCRRAATSLPVDESAQLYQLDHAFCETMRQRRGEILATLQQIVHHIQKDTNLHLDGEYEEGITEDAYETLCEVVDRRLCNVDRLIDDGITSAPAPDTGSGQSEGEDGEVEEAVLDEIRTTRGEREGVLYYSKHTARPQLAFDPKPDNSLLPYRPRLKAKPNAIVPLDQGEQKVVHPYGPELAAFVPEDAMLRPSNHKVNPGPPDWVWVSQPDPLRVVAAILSRQTQFAVALLDHRFRSYLGFSCVLLLATRSTCYAVDAIALRKHMFHLLDPLTNPGIVKVVHGGHMLCASLQRDFDLFVVNMLDVALKTDGSRHSLRSLVHTHLDTAMPPQAAVDWRMRPLPPIVQSVALERVRWLLQLANVLRSKLEHSDLLQMWARGRAICQQLYLKPSPSDCVPSLLEALGDNPDPLQVAVAKALCEWRDHLARDEDESPLYVMPDAMLVQIARTLPTDPPSLLATYRFVPALVKVYAVDILHRLKSEAVAQTNGSHQPRWKLLVGLKEEFVKSVPGSPAMSPLGRGVKRSAGEMERDDATPKNDTRSRREEEEKGASKRSKEEGDREEGEGRRKKQRWDEGGKGGDERDRRDPIRFKPYVPSPLAGSSPNHAIAIDSDADFSGVYIGGKDKKKVDVEEHVRQASTPGGWEEREVGDGQGGRERERNSVWGPVKVVEVVDMEIEGEGEEPPKVTRTPRGGDEGEGVSSSDDLVVTFKTGTDTPKTGNQDTPTQATPEGATITAKKKKNKKKKKKKKKPVTSNIPQETSDSQSPGKNKNSAPTPPPTASTNKTTPPTSKEKPTVTPHSPHEARDGARGKQEAGVQRRKSQTPTPPVSQTDEPSPPAQRHKQVAQAKRPIPPRPVNRPKPKPPGEVSPSGFIF